jgi:serine phosphatase RsbU (regulator of sigma subunit)
MKYYCCTDGIIESFSVSVEMHGSKRLQETLLINNTTKIQGALNSLVKFTNGKKQNDDSTIVEIDFKKLKSV